MYSWTGWLRLTGFSDKDLHGALNRLEIRRLVIADRSESSAIAVSLNVPKLHQAIRKLVRERVRAELQEEED